MWRFTHIIAHRRSIARVADQAGIGAGIEPATPPATSVDAAACPRSRSTKPDRWALPFPSPAAADS